MKNRSEIPELMSASLRHKDSVSSANGGFPLGKKLE